MRISSDHRPNSAFLSELIVVPLALRGVDGKRGAKAGGPWAGLETSSARILQQIDSAVGGELSARIKSAGFKFEPAKRFDLQISPRLVEGLKRAKTRQIRLFVFGPDKSTHQLPKSAAAWGSEQDWRTLGGDAGQAARAGMHRSVAIIGGPVERIGEADSAAAIRLSALVEGFTLGRYQYVAYKSKNRSTAKAKRPVKSEPDITVITSMRLTKGAASAFQSAVRTAQVRAAATVFCRDLVNRPPSDLHPADLVKAARKVSAVRGSRITLKAFGRAKLKRLGANGILTVARGSGIEPFLIHAQYKPQKRRNCRRIVLVGKGVTFDSGGLSIKTGKGMEDMKCDMAGAAAVISVLKAIAELPPQSRPQHEIHVLVPTVENLINEKSVKPGDVFFALNGKSVEVLNTDAEGRLILADALSYAERLKPDLIIDLATLTGACVAALGSDYAGLFSNSPAVEDELRTAGRQTGDQVWPLPLAKEYRPMINSSVADIQNIGPGGPGAITAALFLQEFVPAKTNWAHLDIAGPAFVTRGNEVVRPGGTGFGVRLLLRILGSDLESLN